jgi:DNA-binding NtrC family response regulator
LARGSFAGAITQKIGRLDLADQGTLFLDDVGDIPLELQPKLLSTPVIVCAPLFDPAVYLDVMNRGAFDFMAYPYRTDEVNWILDTAFRRRAEPARKSKANSGRAISA